MRISRILLVCAIASLLAAPAFGQASLSATPQAPYEGLADCSDMTAYQEPFDAAAFGTARTTDAEAGFRVFESFFNAAPTGATASRHWGIEIDFGSPTFLCGANDTANFNVAFWGQTGGAPDTFNQIAAVNDAASVETDTGVPFGGFGNVVAQDINLGNLDITGAVWVSHERVNDADSCFWLWVDETALGTYDDQGYQEGAGGFVTSDQPFCLAGTGGGDDGGDGGDGGVPATTGVGVALMVLLLGGSSAYFLRRK